METSFSGISAKTIAVLFDLVFGWLFVGSGSMCLWLRKHGREIGAEAFLKISCPACGVDIRFDDRNLGRKIPCPHCKHAFSLRRPENLKRSCFFCRGHIEFPAHVIGTKMACPHCKMDIALKEAT